MLTLDELNKAAPDTPVFVLHLYDRARLKAAIPVPFHAPRQRRAAAGRYCLARRTQIPGPLAEFELLFIDVQGFDPGLEGRWWNSQLSRCSERSGNPASSLSQRRLDNLPLGSRLNIRSRRRFSPRCLRRSPFGKP